MNSLRLTAAALVVAVAALGGCATNRASPSNESIVDKIDRFQSSPSSRPSSSATCRTGAVAYCEYRVTLTPTCTCVSQDEVTDLYRRPY